MGRLDILDKWRDEDGPPPGLADQILERMREDKDHYWPTVLSAVIERTSFSQVLTPCEQRVVDAADEGLSRSQIAARFQVSENTVKKQLSVGRKKLRGDL